MVCRLADALMSSHHDSIDSFDSIYSVWASRLYRLFWLYLLCLTTLSTLLTLSTLCRHDDCISSWCLHINTRHTKTHYIVCPLAFSRPLSFSPSLLLSICLAVSLSFSPSLSVQRGPFWYIEKALKKTIVMFPTSESFEDKYSIAFRQDSLCSTCI